MKNIMLVCGAGMSTSLLVTKMEKAANALGDEVHIFALPISEGIKRLEEVDCCLLGPQVRYEKKNIEQKIQELGLKVPFDVIDMRDYGTMNGKAVFEMAKKLIGD